MLPDCVTNVSPLFDSVGWFIGRYRLHPLIELRVIFDVECVIIRHDRPQALKTINITMRDCIKRKFEF